MGMWVNVSPWRRPPVYNLVLWFFVSWMENSLPILMKKSVRLDLVYCKDHGCVLHDVWPFKARWFLYVALGLLTHSTVQSVSWAANRFAASQVIPRISRNPKVHYRTHKRPPTVSILGLPNPVHIPTSHRLEIHRNIIHPSTPRSPHWVPSLRFPHLEPIGLMFKNSKWCSLCVECFVRISEDSDFCCIRH